MSILSLLMLTCGVALAEPAGVVTDLAGTLREFNAANSKVVVVAAAGADAAAAVDAALKAEPSLGSGIYVVNVSIDGSPMDVVRGTLQTTGLTCALWVSKALDGWDAVPYGNCSASRSGGLPPALPIVAAAPKPPTTVSMLTPYTPPVVPVAPSTGSAGASAPASSTPATSAAPPAAQGVAVEATPPIPVIPPAFAPPRPETGPCSTAALLLSAPDPTAALLLSSVVGFGTGHFYAGKKPAGVVFAIVDVLVVAGTTVATAAYLPNGIGIGSSALALSHLVQGASAPFVVTQERKTLLARCR